MDVREYIKNKNLLFDGAMGTYFAAKTDREARECEAASLDMADVIEEIHREYISAGAKAIRTNTFAAVSMEESLRESMIRASCGAAKRAAEGKDVFIFADMGPLEKNADANCYKRAADIFMDEGISLFIFETLHDNSFTEEAAKYIKEKAAESFIIVSYAVNPSGYTNIGRHYLSLFEEADKCPYIDAVGMNCVSGPLHLKKLAEKADISKPLSIMPNAGYPTVLGSRTVYGKIEKYFAGVLGEIAAEEADIVGGCCGTTPSFTEECSKAGIEVLRQRREKPKAENGRRTERAENSFLDKLSRGERVLAVELDPPEGTDTEFFTSGAVKLKRAGADIITIADCPVARPRMDSALLSCKLKREFNIDCLPHMACRDRNLNAIKALLLGMNAENVNNILAITGDPVPSDRRDEVKSVFNFNSRMLIKFISSLNENEFSAPMNICAALNINAANFSVQLKLAEEKIENGAGVFLTQPLMTSDALENLKRARKSLKAKILCGIMPIVSYKNALYMQSEIAGITVDERLIAMFEGKSREESEKIGMEAALSAAKAARPYCDGFYVITPFKRVELICKIIEEIRDME